MRRSPPRQFRGRLPRAIGMDGRCNGGTRDLIQINESMPITLSIVLAAIERRLKCQQRFLGRNASFAHGRLSSAEASDVVADDGSSGEAPDLPRHSYDASLLFRRMAALQIDRDELASNDPLLFRELQGLCTLCCSKERCVLDLAQERDEPGNQGWREYCLNATTLNALGAVQNCARAAQYLRTPVPPATWQTSDWARLMPRRNARCL